MTVSPTTPAHHAWLEILYCDARLFGAESFVVVRRQNKPVE